jgi:hypothetical protein
MTGLIKDLLIFKRAEEVVAPAGDPGAPAFRGPHHFSSSAISPFIYTLF